MTLLFARILALTLAFILGISKEVAAQYGILTCTYLVKGQVEAGLCEKPVEGILVKVSDLANPARVYDSVYTGADGRYTLHIDLTTLPDRAPSLLFEAIDQDGEADQGRFVSHRSTLKPDPGNVYLSRKEEWNQEYLFLRDDRILLRKEDCLPCADE